MNFDAYTSHRLKTKMDSLSIYSRLPSDSLDHKYTIYALKSLREKVIEKGETPENSLVAALFPPYIYNQIIPHFSRSFRKKISFQSITYYTPTLEAVAKKVISLYNRDSNLAQINLINLLFRSVGGTLDTNIKTDEFLLDEIDNDAWVRLITNLADEVRHTPSDCVLISADPDSAVRASTIFNKVLSSFVIQGNSAKAITEASISIREYRKIYEEFWYVLGLVAVTDGNISNFRDFQIVQPAIKCVLNDNHPSTILKNEKLSQPINFNVNPVKNLICHLSELVFVGQPDIRAASVIAILYIGHAVIDITVSLGEKLKAVTRQCAAAMESKLSSCLEKSKKIEKMRHKIKSIKKTRTALEDYVIVSITHGIFVQKFRDSNWCIRTICLESLGSFMIQRPDIFLTDKYLNYFGLMISDKVDCVRYKALTCLLTLFENSSPENFTLGASYDSSLLVKILLKFLPRISECAMDVCIHVQERSIKLLLYLLRFGYLDDVKDKAFWNLINMRALVNDTSLEVRVNALYFVIEQLEAFDQVKILNIIDDSSEREENNTTKKYADKRSIQKLDAIASWASYSLTIGLISTEKIRFDPVVNLVCSLREMPEHSHLVTNWSAMLQALNEDMAVTNSESMPARNNVHSAKLKFLAQILKVSIISELGVLEDSLYFLNNLDTPLFSNLVNKKRKMKKGNISYLRHEYLSIELLNTLPELLNKFQSDNYILSCLVYLPQYIIPAIFSLPEKRLNYIEIIKEINNIYVHSTNNEVLNNVTISIAYLCKKKHPRVSEVRAITKKYLIQIKENIYSLLSGYSQLPKCILKLDNSCSTSQTIIESLEDLKGLNLKKNTIENEYSLYLNLIRLRYLAKRMDISEFTGDGCDEGKGIEEFCETLARGLSHRLITYKTFSDVDISEYTLKYNSNHDISNGKSKTRDLISGSIREGLAVLLSVISWMVLSLCKKHDLIIESISDIINDRVYDENNIVDHIILRLRNNLISLIEMCFEQHIDEKEYECSASQKTWSESIQIYAGICASDLRTLFPHEWSNASSPFLRAFAITDDSRLIGGYVRYIQSKYFENKHSLELREGVNNTMMYILLPLVRSLVTNWKFSNIHEAGVVLTHVIGSGQESSILINSMTSLLLKVEPVRLLEAQMASLRASYEDWIYNEPEEVRHDNLTGNKIAIFGLAEKKHIEQFNVLEQRASKFSSSLGVKKLDDTLLSALLGFLREGIKFSFTSKSEDDVVLGGRLSFLTLMSKYTSWVKNNRIQTEILRADIEENESILREKAGFTCIHKDDLTALSNFRSTVGLSHSSILKVNKSTSTREYF